MEWIPSRKEKGHKKNTWSKVFAKAQSIVGTNCDKNRGHSGEGVVVITTQQHERGNIWNIIVVVS